jgi:NADPH:quinone reductase-like Zn-dependent oxidoreductase
MTDKDPRDQNPTMKSLAIKEYCTPDQYAILTLPVPKIEQADQLLIKVHAASMNPIDVKVAVGVAKWVRSEQ